MRKKLGIPFIVIYLTICITCITTYTLLSRKYFNHEFHGTQMSFSSVDHSTLQNSSFGFKSSHVSSLRIDTSEFSKEDETNQEQNISEVIENNGNDLSSSNIEDKMNLKLNEDQQINIVDSLNENMISNSQQEIIEDTEYTYGALTFFKMNYIETELFKEMDIPKPDYIYNEIKDYSDQRYEYQVYDPTVEADKDYYRFRADYYNISRTKHFSMISIPTAPTLQDLFDPYTFVGFIKSRAPSTTLRLATRETYANMTAIPESEGKAKFYFVLGISEPYQQTIDALLEEQKKYNDLFIINIVDSYQNLTLKALIPEDIFVASKAKTPYYILGDDDSCIKTRDLLHLLKTTPRNHYYAGKCVHNKIGEKGIPHGKHSASLLAMPFKLSFAIANLIVMSNDVIYSHIENVRHLPAYTHIDDGQIGILSEIGKTSVQCPNFVLDLRSKPTRGYAKTVPQYAIHYCKNGRIMKSVCYGINDYSIQPDPVA